MLYSPKRSFLAMLALLTASTSTAFLPPPNSVHSSIQQNAASFVKPKQPKAQPMLNPSIVQQYKSCTSNTKRSMLPLEHLDIDYFTTTTNTLSASSITSALTSASTFLSTIDADIDNISNDQFGLVFAGGIAVMIGGVLSAVIVGFILESGNSYANVVADSYAQGGDEEFWESLSPEDQVKARELLKKIKESKNKGASGDDDVAVSVESDNGNVELEPAITKKSKAVETEKKKEISMFSDYED